MTMFPIIPSLSSRNQHSCPSCLAAGLNNNNNNNVSNESINLLALGIKQIKE